MGRGRKAAPKRDNETEEEFQKRLETNKLRCEQRKKQNRRQKDRERKKKQYVPVASRRNMSSPSPKQQPRRQSQGLALARDLSTGKLKLSDDQLKMCTDVAKAEFATYTAEETTQIVKEQRGLLKDASQMTPAGVKTMKYLAQSSGKKVRPTESDDDGSIDSIQNNLFAEAEAEAEAEEFDENIPKNRQMKKCESL